MDSTIGLNLVAATFTFKLYGCNGVGKILARDRGDSRGENGVGVRGFGGNIGNSDKGSAGKSSDLRRGMLAGVGFN